MKRIFTDLDFGSDSNSDEESSQENKSKKFVKKREATLFLVDGSKKMFSPASPGENSPFVNCLTCIRNFIRKKIFAEEKCLYGMIILGTKTCENSLNLSNLTMVQELSWIGAPHILKIDEILKTVENSTYETVYGHDLFSVGDTFWLARHIFHEKSKVLHKSIVLFTNEDNPTCHDKNDFSRAISSAGDMYKSFISFKLIHIGKQFDVNKFYKRILQAAHNDAHYKIFDPVIDVSEMQERLGKRSYSHNILSRIPFVIGKDFEIGVSVHFLVRKKKLPLKLKLSKSTNERVTTKMQLFETETGSVVHDSTNLIKSLKIGQKDIDFTLNELKTMSDYGKIELRLLGFKPASVICLENYVKPCAFIYPDELNYKGSSVFFTALLKRCIAKQVVPICTLCLRKTSACRFIALIGQGGSNEKDDKESLPQGFIGFFLPFAEEVRPFEDISTNRATPEQVDAAVKFINKLKFNYTSKSFQNPKLQTHWASIEAIALDLEKAEEVNDSTYPDYDLISKRTKGFAENFVEAVYEEDYDPEVYASKKRKPKPLKIKKESSPAPNPDICPENVESMLREGKGKQLSNDVLKAYLKLKGQGKNLSKVKKADLIEKACSCLNLD